MTCLGHEESINRYLDGALGPSEQAHFERHLAGCQVCQTELAQTRALFAVLDGLQEVTAPADLSEAVLEGLPRPPASPLGRWLLATQAAVTVVLLALSYPTLKAWYGRTGAWLAPGWLSNMVADVAAWGQSTSQGLIPTLPVSALPAWPEGLGLTWPQATLMAVALVGLWALGNRLLLAARPNGTGGTT
jgi:anti-sigma factor RsiW